MIFTIAIPTYNNANSIEETIQSCINQDFDLEYEILVSNNNSSDNTENILQQYKEQLKIVKTDTTLTMYENHNNCLNNAQGEYIIFCHSDDKLLPDALNKYYQIIKKRNFPQKYILWGRSMFRDYYTVWSRAGYQLDQIASGVRALDLFIYGGGVTPSGTCFSVNSLQKEGGFLKSNHPLAPSDWTTAIKLVLRYFEFEMSDRIFFSRTYASTANERDKEIIYIAMEEAFKNFLFSISNDEKNQIIEYTLHSHLFNIFLTKFFVSIETNYKKAFKKKYYKFLLHNPQKLRYKKHRKLLYIALTK